MASFGPTKGNHNPYQTLPDTSGEADVVYFYELGHLSTPIKKGQDRYVQLPHADSDASHPEMGEYGGKSIAEAQLSETTVREYIPGSEENHNTAVPSWLPYTLRWHILSSILGLTVVLELLVVVFHVISSRDSGLVDDDGSGGIVVASKFVPTVLAVIHVLLISIILNDVKRTQAFAHLASPHGASGKRSLTWTAEAWWDALLEGFPSRQRKANWALLSAALTFMLGFLIVSPFSSSLFATQDIIFTYEVPFKQLDLSSVLPLQTIPLGATYFRTVGNVLQNVTTSAWITDQYAILPIWPARIDSVPLGPLFSDSVQTWAAKTTVFNVEENCQRMDLAGLYSQPFDNNPLITNWTSVKLSTSSGCTLNITSKDAFNGRGGSVWSSLSNITAAPGTLSFDADGVSYAKDNCRQDEFFVITTGWYTNMTANNFTITGQACRAHYYMGDTDATVTFNEGRTLVRVTIDELQYSRNRLQIPESTANLSSFQDAFLSPNWTVHLRQPSQNLGPYSTGPATLLSALYNFSPEEMVSDPSMLQNVGNLKQRFFGELLRDKFDETSLDNPTNITGTTTQNRRRVVVVPAVAIILEVILGIQLLLLAVVFFKTRLSRRPLGLSTDPAPAMSVAKLIAQDPGTLRSLEGLHGSTLEEIRSVIAEQRYQLICGQIRLIDLEDDLHQSTSPEFDARQTMAAIQSRPQSFTFGLWLILTLTLLLSVTLIAIAYLYWYSGIYGLYQTAFVYAFDITIGGVDLSNVNPASILTTFVAVFIGLWWGALDTTLRRIQPFLSLAKKPVTGDEGLLVSYISSYLLRAVWKAFRRRHWVLAAVCTGAFLSEIFTIAMSSIWQREPGSLPFQVNIQRQLELRKVPRLSDATLQFTSHAGNYKQNALAGLFSNMRTSWIYGAAVQISLNGSEPPWSSNGWSFVPHNLGPVPQTDVQNAGNTTSSPTTTMNVTVETSGMRARLECSPHEHLNLLDSTNWLTEWDFTNTSQWNETLSPDILKRGFELGLPDAGDNTVLFLDNNASMTGNYTTFFVNNKRLQCCQNITDGQIGSSSLGYWSPNLRNNSYYPDFATSWPSNFTVKWIRGRPVEGYRETYPPESEHTGSGPPRLMWAEKPQMAALNCMPIIETANASVTVSTDDSHVISFDLIGEPQPDPYAWSDDFKQHKNYEGICDAPQCGNIYSINITTSHGILFVTGLLGAADLSDFVGTGIDTYDTNSENIGDQTFNIREPGLNVDLMTYSMLSLVNYDHDALLDLNTLERTAQQTFTTLFQNFASNNVSFETGGYVFQPLNEALPADLDTPRKRADTPPANPTVTLNVSRPVELLQMSKPAAWICMLILAYLIVASVILAIASRRHTKMLLRKIDSIADVAVLMAGSEKLLNLAREKSTKDLKNDHVTKARLGWFTGANGEQRWGIELVGGEDDKKYEADLPPYEGYKSKPLNDEPGGLGITMGGGAPEYDADGVPQPPSSGPIDHGADMYGPGHTHYEGYSAWHGGGDLGVERVPLTPSPISPEHGSHIYEPSQVSHEEYYPISPPYLEERRAPSIEIHVDDTPFSSYFVNEEATSNQVGFRRSWLKRISRGRF
ncbi:hypothetical protein F5Y05DRAFT_336131 [Hypoxylon sp. FL0543]|nr:hypothetical protein F5Y05DRAFT_336131 [Hypoxylon sp. FL0543]